MPILNSEPALNRRAVNVNGSNTLVANLLPNGAHSSGDLTACGKRKVGKKLPKLFTKKKNATAQNSSSSENGFDQKGVLRISAPFLNNPLVQHVSSTN